MSPSSMARPSHASASSATTPLRPSIAAWRSSSSVSSCSPSLHPSSYMSRSSSGSYGCSAAATRDLTCFSSVRQFSSSAFALNISTALRRWPPMGTPPPPLTPPTHPTELCRNGLCGELAGRSMPRAGVALADVAGASHALRTNGSGTALDDGTPAVIGRDLAISRCSVFERRSSRASAPSVFMWTMIGDANLCDVDALQTAAPQR
eukprot:6192870-Pleurochrysis_carterae.AAC.2